MTERLRLNEDNFIPLKDIYDTYKIETILDKESLLAATLFGQILQRVFSTKSKLKKLHGVMQTVYGLEWKDKIEHNKNSDFDVHNLRANLPSDLMVSEVCTDYIITQRNTNTFCNGNQVAKKIKFDNNAFSVTVRGVPVPLAQHQISGYYTNTREGLLNVLLQIDSILLCNGIQVTQNIQMQPNFYEEKTGTEEKQIKIIRSMYCKMVTEITTYKNESCKSCRRMTINTVKESQPDLTTQQIIKNLMPKADPKLVNFMLSQVLNSNNTDKHQNKWDSSIISECLTWYTRSPQSYREVRDSRLLILPSPDLLILYKNNISQKPGFEPNIFYWMHKESDRLEIPPYGKVGGILIDEMSIQQKLEIKRSGKNLELVGFIEMGEESHYTDILKKGQHSQDIGTHVFQMMFQGLTGFRFPFAHFISNNVTATDMYILVWEAVDMLSSYGFDAKYICMDGASNNRSFLNMNFPGRNPIEMNMKTTCPTDPFSHMIFLMDPSHTFKKIRNNILKSGNKESSTRMLKLPSGDEVHWAMWIDAYHWDNKNPVQIHKALTNEHLFPTQSQKMRNKLAEDALNSEMLNLMLAYKQSLGKKGDVLNGAIELLQHSSTMIDIFRDRRSINCNDDERILKLKEVQLWFLNWENKTDQNESMTKTAKSKCLMSRECMQDIQSTLLGFLEICFYVTQNHHGWSVIPAMINSDAIENQFCQHRGKFNGSNTNPTALQYRHNINSVILGQAAVSKKSNAFASMSKCENLPFSTIKSVRKSTKRRAGSENCKAIKCLRM